MRLRFERYFYYHRANVLYQVQFQTNLMKILKEKFKVLNFGSNMPHLPQVFFSGKKGSITFLYPFKNSSFMGKKEKKLMSDSREMASQTDGAEIIERASQLVNHLVLQILTLVLERLRHYLRHFLCKKILYIEAEYACFL